MLQHPVEIDDLFRFALVGDAQISHDGRQVAYVVKTLDREKDEYRSHIWLWADGESRQLTTGGKDSAPRWSPDGRWLAFLSGREGKQQIYLLPLGGGEPVRLTKQKLGAGSAVWSPDSRRIAFEADVLAVEEPEEGKQPTARITERAVYKFDGRGFIDDRRRQIFVVDLPSRIGEKVGEPRQLTGGDFDHSSPAWSPDGEYLAFSSDHDPEWDLRSAAAIWVVPRDGGEPRRITDGQGLWMSPVFSPDGSRIACVGYAKPADAESTYYPQLWTFPRGGGDGENLLAETDRAVGNSVGSDWSIAGEDGLVWQDDGIYFLISQDGTANVFRCHDHLDQLSHGCHHVMDFSVAAGKIAFTLSDATHPAEIALRDIATPPNPGDDESRITSHNAEALAAVRVVSPERLAFHGAEGEAITGWLMKPAGWVNGQRYPLIVYIHGGPVSAYGETFFHEFQLLAGAGFGVFYCNPHGSSSCGQRFQVSIMGDWGNLDYQDVMAGTDRVIEEPWVDANRLGVAGGSYGGFMVNWIISHTDRFAAASTQRSICNMVSQGGTSDWAATRGERLLATPEGDPEKLWAMSPLKYVANVRTPTLILHSERDDRCPIEEGEQWYMALKRRRVPVRFVRFPEESHGLSRAGTPSRRVERLCQILGWFRLYL
jgi:dipeptidyl aminopeptidase/acylaminoacyl peptidase